jgi:hypothetical protein
MKIDPLTLIVIIDVAAMACVTLLCIFGQKNSPPTAPVRGRDAV